MFPCAIETSWTIVKNLNKIKNKKVNGRGNGRMRNKEGEVGRTWV